MLNLLGIINIDSYLCRSWKKSRKKSLFYFIFYFKDCIFATAFEKMISNVILNTFFVGHALANLLI